MTTVELWWLMYRSARAVGQGVLASARVATDIVRVVRTAPNDDVLALRIEAYVAIHQLSEDEAREVGLAKLRDRIRAYERHR